MTHDNDAFPLWEETLKGQAMTEARHTELPWTYEVHELSEGMSAIIYDNSGLRVLDHISEIEAAFIVKAVNNHAALIKALSLILPMAKGYAHANRVGSNAKYIEVAEAALKAVQS